MPVIRVESGVSANEAREELVRDLANELTGQGARGEAVIFEIPVRQTETYHVIVAWDAWRRVPASERSAIIVDAYGRKPPGAAPPQPADITLAMGLTWDDPLVRGALPYAVQSHARSTEADRDQVEQALLDEGGVKTSGGIHLRFPHQEMADRVWRRLQERMPEGHWAVVYQGPSIDD